MGSGIAYCRDGFVVPIEVRSDVGASFAASFADERRFELGEPDIILPRLSTGWK